MEDRQLATIRTIEEVAAIPNADAICAYRVDGWWVVDQIGKYQPGDQVIYCEVDSWIPHSIAPFLSKGQEPRLYNDVPGERLRTVKLRGQISQGLFLPLELAQGWNSSEFDLDEFLAIQKWERPLSPELAGMTKGNFPSFIQKTNQNRVQNLRRNTIEDKCYEVTEKLDGSSMTVYLNNGEFGVCSHNLDLKESESNTFWNVARKQHLEEALRGINLNLAFQGELIGPGIQGNKYKLTDFKFMIFDIFRIDMFEYMTTNERLEICKLLQLLHVPVIKPCCNLKSGLDMKELIEYADGFSELNENTLREGLVFKCLTDASLSFKVISNKFLLKDK